MAGIISLGFALSIIGCANQASGNPADTSKSTPPKAEAAKAAPQKAMVNPEEMMQKGEKCLEDGDYAGGLKIFQDVLASMNKSDTQISGVYYDIACAYSRMKQKAPALEYLQKAIDSGYNNSEWMQQDPDLAFLQEMPEFKAMIAKMSQIVEIPPTAKDFEDEKEAVRLIEETHKLKFKEMPKFKILTPDQFAKAFGGDARSTPQGFYRWSDKTLYLRNDLSAVKDAATRIHETFHALQDQLFNMGEMQKQVKTIDQNYTLRGVIEGDATLIFIEAMTNSGNARIMLNPAMIKMMSGGNPIYDNSANGEAAKRMKLFDYSIGAHFIDEVKKAKGWEGVNAIYTHLPASTEQMLHPEKYLQQNDPPIAVTIPDLSGVLGADWKMSRPNTLGEFGIMLNLLKNPKSGPLAEEAAAGWGGDTFVELQKQGQKMGFAIHKTAWDTPKDAKEFYDATCAALEDTNPPEKGDNFVSYKRADNKMDYVMMKDTAVLVIYDIPQDLNDKVVKAVMEK